MYNPRDFIPSKYNKKSNRSGDDSGKLDRNKKNELDSPWSDLAKEPQTPEYRSNITLSENGIKNELDASSKLAELKEISQKQQETSSSNLKKSSGNRKKLTGLLVVFFLVIGVFASYILSKQNQDTRQQAFMPCEIGSDPYCGSNGRCISGYRFVDGECIPNNVTVTPIASCETGFYSVNGHCITTRCQDRDGDGKYVCGYGGDKDPCSEDSMGGDWCINESGVSVACEELGMIRCKCSPGSNVGYWVIGIADNCDELCKEAGVDCPDCPTPTPTPTQPPGEPTPPPTKSPTPPPQPLTCGEFGCTQNSDCKDGLTCQAVTTGNVTKKICSKGENQLFCAANPTTENCCTSQPMPVCANIDILDANNNLMETDDDKNLKPGDEVRFRCSAVGNQDIDFDYEFRIWAPGENYWDIITDQTGTVAKNVSSSYVIVNTGKHVVQGRICWGSECQVWETVKGAPEFDRVTAQAITPCTTDDICENGYVCSATPAGGCPIITVNGETAMSACASAPFCRLAEGIICQDSGDCFDGYSCYQPPMPDCPAGTICTQVMPDKYCTKQ